MANQTAFAWREIPADQLPHDDRRNEINVAIWTVAALASVCLILRVFTKLNFRRSLWWDDYIMILAWATYISSAALTSWSVTYGEGLHVWDVDPRNYIHINFLGRLSGSVILMAAVLSKTSFAVTLLRIAPSRRMRFAIWAIIVTMNIFIGLNVLFLWIRCTPIERLWNPSIPGSCWPGQIFTIYSVVAVGFSAAMDFVLALLPWHIVWNLQMERREKFGIALCMSLGLVAGATGAVKTALMPTLRSADFSFSSVSLINWGGAEVGVTIVAASLPVLRMLFRNVRHATASRNRADYDFEMSPSAAERYYAKRSKMSSSTRASRASRVSQRWSHRLSQRVSRKGVVLDDETTPHVHAHAHAHAHVHPTPALQPIGEAHSVEAHSVEAPAVHPDQPDTDPILPVTTPLSPPPRVWRNVLIEQHTSDASPADRASADRAALGLAPAPAPGSFF